MEDNIRTHVTMSHLVVFSFNALCISFKGIFLCVRVEGKVSVGGKAALTSKIDDIIYIFTKFI